VKRETRTGGEKTHAGVRLQLDSRVVLSSLARDLLTALGLDSVVIGNDLLDGSLRLLHGGGRRENKRI
jgi:hypothetical protein